MHVVGLQRLRVLILDEEVPWPPNSGKRIRTWNLLRRLSRRHDLHLVTYGPINKEAQAKLAQHCFTVTALDPLPPSEGPRFWARLLSSVFSGYPYSVVKHFTGRMQRHISEVCKRQQFDLVHCEWIPYARYETRGIPRLIVAHNVESEILRRRANHDGGLIGSWFFGLQAKRMKAFEREAATKGAHVVAVSELDAETFRSYGVRNVTIVPNGVDLDYFRPMPQVFQTDSLLFVGSLDWHANEDAVKDFAIRILPLIRSRNPNLTFQVVGRRPSNRLVTSLQELQGVQLIGEVPDVRPYMAQARAVVVPLRIGGGTRIKILEALAMGKPVISTSIGAEGLEIKNQRDYLLANTPEEFVTRIDALFANPEEQLRLGENGRALVEKLYGWDAAAEKLEGAWSAAAGRCEVVTPGPVFAASGARR